MSEQIAIRVAFLVVPVIPVAVGAALTPMANFDVITLVGFALIFYLISMALTAAFGLPVFYWLRKRNIARWWSAVVCGFGIGAAIGLLLRLPNIRYVSDATVRHDILLLGVEGAMVALVFWLIWQAGRAMDRRRA
jgi:hypothetical protein